MFSGVCFTRGNPWQTHHEPTPAIDQPNGFQVSDWPQDEAESLCSPLARVLAAKAYNNRAVQELRRRALNQTIRLAKQWSTLLSDYQRDPNEKDVEQQLHDIVEDGKKSLSAKMEEVHNPHNNTLLKTTLSCMPFFSMLTPNGFTVFRVWFKAKANCVNSLF